MIVSYKSRQTQAIAIGHAPRGFPANVLRAAQRKLMLLRDAAVLDDLRNPPGNRLEALKGNRSGQHSIRINDQWRVCFNWTSRGAENVEIVDYH